MKVFNFFKKFSKGQLIIGGIVLLSVVLIGWLIFPKPKKEPVLFAVVKRGNIESIVSASGNLAGKNTANLKFKISGKLAYFNVSEGDAVSAGNVVAGLDTQDLSITLQQAYNTLRLKQAAAEKILDDVKDHSSDETFTQRQTRTLAEAERDSAYDNVKAAQRTFQDAILISPISGIITQVGPVAGQVISVTDTIAQVVDKSEVYFDADVDEADIGSISLNQQAKVELDAYPDKVFDGTVTQVLLQTKTSTSGATTIKVRIKLQNPLSKFVSGLNGQASIILSSVKNVLTVPTEAVRDDNTVVVKSGKGFKSAKVEPGIKSDTNVEIKTGLNEGDQIITNPTSVKGV